MDKAVALDDSVAELHVALGNQHCVALDWARASVPTGERWS